MVLISFDTILYEGVNFVPGKRLFRLFDKIVSIIPLHKIKQNRYQNQQMTRGDSEVHALLLEVKSIVELSRFH